MRVGACVSFTSPLQAGRGRIGAADPGEGVYRCAHNPTPPLALLASTLSPASGEREIAKRAETAA